MSWAEPSLERAGGVCGPRYGGDPTQLLPILTNSDGQDKIQFHEVYFLVLHHQKSVLSSGGLNKWNKQSHVANNVVCLSAFSIALALSPNRTWRLAEREEARKCRIVTRQTAPSDLVKMDALSCCIYCVQLWKPVIRFCAACDEDLLWKMQALILWYAQMQRIVFKWARHTNPQSQHKEISPDIHD